MPADAARPLLLVDAASLYFRAFHGVPESAARAPDGSPVNAVRGFLDMISTLIRTRRPGRLVAALDEDWRPAWRVALIPSYKAHRIAAPTTRLNANDPSSRSSAGQSGVESAPVNQPNVEAVPDTLAPQVPIILDMLAAIGITTMGAADYEADDVLGTLATREPGPTEIASGDRDLFQLVDDQRQVRLLYCGRGVAKLEVCDEASVRAKYGVPPSRYADFATLRGDPSDGLPGVPGIGATTAARLITQYGGLSEILAAPHAPALRTRLLAAAGYLSVAPKVVEVARDVPLPTIDLTLPETPADPGRLADLAARWNLAGAVRRLTEALAAHA